MARFSIRELLLLTVVVALALGWWLHARRNARDTAELRAEVDLQKQLVELIRLADQLEQERVDEWKSRSVAQGMVTLEIPPSEEKPKVNVIPISPPFKPMGHRR